MGFFLKTTLGLVLLLGIADYRTWREVAKRYEFPQAVLDEALLQQMSDRPQFVRIQSVQQIPGSEPDELGLRLGVSTVFDPDKVRTVEVDLKAYLVDNVMTFTHPCLRPSPPEPGTVYKAELQEQLVGARYNIPVPGMQPRYDHFPVRPVRKIDWSADSVTLQVGLVTTYNRGQDMITGQAWPECKS
ncbi:hypothetical protein [Marinimicrobium agarilyticum]|uniref:hypothetical protein n=1 Tax=Marinimicrobium agarilyticum TaxID=306546 RepID=UPI00041C2C5A|nr:hypothetical protein [Marinimicrobium agarilyticum]